DAGPSRGRKRGRDRKLESAPDDEQPVGASAEPFREQVEIDGGDDAPKPFDRPVEWPKEVGAGDDIFLVVERDDRVGDLQRYWPSEDHPQRGGPESERQR